MLLVDLDKMVLNRVIDAAIASLKRSKVKQTNPIILQAIDQEIALLQNAANTAKVNK